MRTWISNNFHRFTWYRITQLYSNLAALWLNIRRSLSRDNWPHLVALKIISNDSLVMALTFLTTTDYLQRIDGELPWWYHELRADMAPSIKKNIQCSPATNCDIYIYLHIFRLCHPQCNVHGVDCANWYIAIDYASNQDINSYAMAESEPLVELDRIIYSNSTLTTKALKVECSWLYH